MGFTDLAGAFSIFHFQQWISAHGYLGIFFLLMLGIFGLPIPDEPLLIFSGYLISRGKLHPAGVFLASFSGSAVGISVSYLLGRLLGLRVVGHYGNFVGVSHEKLERVHSWFRGLGHWVLVFGYYVPGVRHVTAVVAGISALELAPFMLFAYFGAVLWVSTFLSIGYFFADKWDRISESIQDNLVAAFCIVAVAGLLYLFARRVMGRRRRALN